MQIHYPDKKLLSHRRILLVLTAIPAAFIISLIFPSRSLKQLLALGMWAGAFLLLYLWYLPQRNKAISLNVTDAAVTLHSGVFAHRLQALPLPGIQITSIRQSPLERLLGICTLHILAPGGKLVLPGLPRGQAENLIELWGIVK